MTCHYIILGIFLYEVKALNPVISYFVVQALC